LSSGHRTSTIPRPDGARDASGPVGGARPDDTRLIQRKRSRNVLAVVGLVITAALAAAVFVLPFQAWMNQRRELARSSANLAELEAANGRLEAQNAQLQTPEGIAEAARDDLGYQQANEEIVAALPPPDVPSYLPRGWPYELVTQILVTRVADRAAGGGG
jgi:cell division protein FtsB